MPEGDTIWRTARTLRTALRGRTVHDVKTEMAGLEEAGLQGLHVRDVESRGKNLLLWFSDRRALYTHMRMTGSWHVYRCGEPWRRPLRQANVAITTDQHVAVCFNAPVVQLLTELGVKRHRTLSRLGPDLLSELPDFEDMTRRSRRRDAQAVGEVLMCQDVACGIGNVYKSETLFLEGVSPFVKIRDLSPERLRATLERARALMLQNLTGYPRTTRFPSRGSRYWVYGRRGELCHRCSDEVRMSRQGESGRSTYWCPQCQPPA
ncbi:MAG: Fpg/Nei family DNA glycosylase [Myxococcota bacterium]